MVDRQLVGDFALAVLLALPTAALSRPEARIQKSASSHVAISIAHAQFAERASPARAASLLG
jgi:hypothetical protein